MPSLKHVSPQGEVRAGYGWYVVIILCTLYAISFVDRFFLALIADPVSRSLGINDWQLGFLMGAGFAVVYSLAGLPISHWIDRRSRRGILIFGVCFWSLSTIACGFAVDFVSLAVLRAGIAIGEAVLTPATITVIVDLFPPRKRALPVAVYSAVSGVMSAGAFLLGGVALELAAALAPAWGVETWRIGLVIVGVPGLLVILVLALSIPEPVRRESPRAPGAGEIDDSDVRSFIRHLRRHWRFYLPFYLATGLFVLFTIAMVSWVPTLLVRGHGLSPSTAGYLFGMVGVPAGLLGTFFWSWFATRLERKGTGGGLLLAYGAAPVIASPFFVLAPVSSSPALLMTGLAFAIFCLAAPGVLPPLVIQSYTPPRMRARLMAISLLSITLFGYSVGPMIVPWAAQNWAGDALALGYGLSVLGIMAGPPAALCLFLSRRAFLRSGPPSLASARPVST